MTQIDGKLLDDIFRGALECSDGERTAYIESRCQGDPGLLRRVNRLIEACAIADNDLDEIMLATRGRWLNTIADGAAEVIEDLSGQTIGRWRIDEPLARGGLATVYVAHRDDGHYEQRVAFKVLRRGLDTDDVITRFRTERQILSSMEHPAISQLLDGGTLDDGRPYLVLEYVDGLSITDYCDAGSVGVSDRLRLVIDVLQALHHAHRHLIVHRDIKPSNVMVSSGGRVVLLDFGIAKLLDPAAIPGASTLTRTGVALLTPGYGSPEQHAGTVVTTASDIYQVGAVLYELLAGKRPPSAASVNEHSPSALPSRAIGNTAGQNQVRGDLDAIVCKAMHPDPSQRYASASEMVADLRRFLDGLPVMAQPDTFGYRAYKLARRRPLLLPALAVLVLVAAGYMITLATHNRQILLEQQRTSAAQAFMVDLLGSADPYLPAGMQGGMDIRVVDALDLGVRRLLDEAYGGDDVLRASLLATIAGVYASIDEHDKAIKVRSEALALERALYGDVSEEVILSLRTLAHQYRTTGNYDAAETHYTEQLSAARAFFPPDHPEVGMAESAFALIQSRRGNVAASRALLEDAVAKLRRSPNAYARGLINAVVALARARGSDVLEDTLAMLTETQQVADAVFGADAPLAALVTTQTASSLAVSGDWVAAGAHYDAAIGIYEKRLGRTHGATLAALAGLGDLHQQAGNLPAAEDIYREVLGHYRDKYGSVHMGVARGYQSLAEVTTAQGRYAEAVPLYQSAYDSRLAVLGADNTAVYTPLLSMADAQIRAGAFADAEATAGLAASNLARVAGFGEAEARARCLAALAVEVRGRSSGPETALGRGFTNGGMPAPADAEFCPAPAG